MDGYPETMNVSYNSTVAQGTNYLPVTVTGPFGNPVAGAWVTVLLGDDDVYATGLTDGNGEIVLPIATTASGTATLTVTSHNYAPHLGSITIGQAQSYVDVYDFTIDDDTNGASMGNNNGMVNPGETIQMPINLKNFGLSSVVGVTATLSTTNPAITISDDAETFGTIAPGTSASSQDAFVFSVDGSLLGAQSWILIYLSKTAQPMPGIPKSMWTRMVPTSLPQITPLLAVTTSLILVTRYR